MLLTLFILCATIFGANSQGYEAYSGSQSSVHDVYGESAKGPAVPVEPPHLNSADADLLKEKAFIAVKSTEQQNAQSTNNNDNKYENTLSGTDSSNSLGVVSSGSAASNIGLGYRPPPPPTRRDAQSQGQCAFDEAKWAMEPESAISSAIMFDRTTGIGCEECLKKCSEEYQDHSVPWVCRSLTYDHEWKICDLFAINGTESPYFLAEFHGRDYFAYLAALPPTDEQLASQPKANNPSQPSGINKPASSSSASSSAEKFNKEKHSNNSPVPVDVQNKGDTSLVTPAPDAGIQQEVTASEFVSEASSSASSSEGVNFVTEAPSLSENAQASYSSASAKSYGAKIKNVDENQSQNSSIELHEISASTENQSVTEAQTEIAPASETSSPQLSDFQSALENLKQESYKQESEISGNTGKNILSLSDLSDLKEPKIIKLGKKTTTTTLIRSSSGAPSSEFKSLRSSIHTLPEHIEVGIETNGTGEASPFIQESFSESSSASASAAASASASSSSFLSNSSTSTSSSSTSSSSASSSSSSFSSSSTNSSSEAPLTVVSHATNSKLAKAYGQKAINALNNAAKMSSCDENSLSRFISFEGYRRTDNAAAKPFPLARSVEECVDACDSQRLQACASIMYSETRGCELYNSAIDHSVDDTLKAESGSFYVEKFCIPTKKAQTIRKISPAVPKYILVGHVQEVTDAKSFLECQLSCLNTELEYGFICKSAMWYPQDNDQNCLLNAESRHTQPDVFVSEDPGVVMLYFEQVPEKTPSALKIKAIQQMMRFRDLPLQVERRLLGKNGKKSDISKWTRWSACRPDEVHPTSNFRVRYMKCAQHKDIRKCPKEMLACEKNKTSKVPLTTEKGVCHAVRDALGRKHCPYGMRMKENGQREFCTKPVDCA